jgi:hypothetical protein
MIENVQLTIVKDTANADITVEYDIHWRPFDQLTNLKYSEQWRLEGIDPNKSDTLFVGPVLVGGISSNGNDTTHRTKTATIAWADLDEDPNGLDEIAVVVTLTPLLPTAEVAQSAQVVVAAP